MSRKPRAPLWANCALVGMCFAIVLGLLIHTAAEPVPCWEWADGSTTTDLVEAAEKTISLGVYPVKGECKR